MRNNLGDGRATRASIEPASSLDHSAGIAIAFVKPIYIKFTSRHGNISIQQWGAGPFDGAQPFVPVCEEEIQNSRVSRDRARREVLAEIRSIITDMENE